MKDFQIPLITIRPNPTLDDTRHERLKQVAKDELVLDEF